MISQNVWINHFSYFVSSRKGPWFVKVIVYTKFCLFGYLFIECWTWKTYQASSVYYKIDILVNMLNLIVYGYWPLSVMFISIFGLGKWKKVFHMSSATFLNRLSNQQETILSVKLHKPTYSFNIKQGSLTH